MEKIVYTKPSITELEVNYVNEAMRHEWGEHCYDSITRFESEFARFLGVKHALSTSSCTGALTLGLAAAGLKQGDEVIVADTNWIASVAPIVHLGAKPVFVDILPDSWCLDPEQVKLAITPHTRAILAVHLYGNLCELKALREIANAHKLLLIEDAAEALGSRYDNQFAGSLGDFATFSFHGTKTMTSGEGGMFVTNDTDLFQRVTTLSNHGRKSGQAKQFWPDEIGYKFKMSNIQAALGRAQLQRLSELVERKREVWQIYRELLIDCPEISLNPEPENTRNSVWMPTAVFASQTGVTRERLLAEFKAEQIDARVFFYPLSSLDVFGSQLGQPCARDIAARAINLPSFHDITRAQQIRVAAVLRRLLGRA